MLPLYISITRNINTLGKEYEENGGDNRRRALKPIHTLEHVGLSVK
jgi:hypothetical protein